MPPILSPPYAPNIVTPTCPQYCHPRMFLAGIPFLLSLPSTGLVTHFIRTSPRVIFDPRQGGSLTSGVGVCGHLHPRLRRGLLLLNPSGVLYFHNRIYELFFSSAHGFSRGERLSQKPVNRFNGLNSLRISNPTNKSVGYKINIPKA
jgi:hypothetical protein